MITQNRLKELFTYKDGQLYWKNTRRNKSIKGNIAGRIYHTLGYAVLSVDGSTYRVHRLVFLYHHGYLPKYLDHIDNNKKNNHIKNLRPCTLSQNRCNSRIGRNNTSGIKGVSWNREKKAWYATIKLNGTLKNLGYYWEKELAGQIVRIARVNSHGEFCNHG